MHYLKFLTALSAIFAALLLHFLHFLPHLNALFAIQEKCGNAVFGIFLLLLNITPGRL